MVYNRETAKPRWKAEDVVQFCGWDFLQQMVDLAWPTWVKRLVVAGFLTGGRISENFMLEKKHFNFDNPRVVVVEAMPVMKHYEKIGRITKWKCEDHCKMRWGTHNHPEEPSPDERERHNIVEYMGWKTRPKLAYRTFPFLKKEPLVPVFRELLEGVDGKLFNIKYNTAYTKVTEIGKALDTWIPTHWFRAQRASQLAYEYGYNEHDLIKWFLWSDYDTAFRYARKGPGDLAEKMLMQKRWR